MIKLFNKNFEYPDVSDPELQYKLYKKKEFYSYRIPERIDINDYDKIKKLRENQCKKFEMHPYQSYVANFINPNTPYKGILLFHGLGSGKCITRSQYIYINGNIMRIDDIWSLYKTNIIRDNEGGEWSKPSIELVVNSLDSDKIVKESVIHLYREKVDTYIKKITLENGYNIEITQNHKLNVYNKEWTTDINIGDLIAVPRKLYNCKNKNIFNISNDLAYLFGWQMCKGYEYNNYIILKCRDRKLSSYLITKIVNVSKEYNFNFSKIVDDNYILLRSPYYINLLKSIGYEYGYNLDKRKIPDFIMNANLEIIKSFLCAFFDAKAYICPYDNYIEINTTSEIIIKQIDILCRLFSINMILKKQNNRFYYGLINGYNLNIFNNEIGFQIKYKQNILNSICAKYIPCSTDLEWVKVKSIQLIKYNDYVYDLEINRTHNFVSSCTLLHNTCSAINIAQNFIPQVQKYGTKIHILVPGPLLKEMWKRSLLQCTGETYRKYHDKSIYISDEERERIDKNALSQALQYYKIMSYRNFTKKVLGDKIVEKRVITGQKTKISYKKTEEGEYERDVAIDRIYSLSNTLIIVDEAHHFAGNSYGEALKMILEHKDSVNLKVVLLSATPMKNLADEIIELINFIRPINSPIERDKIFTSSTNHMMEIKQGGIDYFKKMVNGYVSYVRGADPLIYARRIDKGVIPNGLLFTNLIRCIMESFQKETYLTAIKDETEDTLDRKSEAVANFTFPILSTDKKTIIGTYGKDGLNILKNQIKIYGDELNQKIATQFFEGKKDQYLSLADDGKRLAGKILKYPNLRFFSVKFNKALKNISKLVYGKKGNKTAFIYSNLVTVGITLFQEILLENGYLEYQEDFSNYQFKNDTICYYCGITLDNHNNLNKDIPEHKFSPATFIVITGKVGEEEDTIQEDKIRIIGNIFNNVNNSEGKYIKFLLGSKVMSEGISLKNVGEVHILDVHYNIGNIDQAIGRAIRYCSHYDLMNENNIYPEVDVYKYTIALEDKLTTEEELYQKAELKHITIKKIERAMKEVAIDCPHNVSGNMFIEEIEKFKKCSLDGEVKCPSQCDYTVCHYKCENLKLNKQFYDPNRYIYKSIDKNKLDYTTYNYEMSKNEIDFVKIKIKDMYVLNYIYTLDQIIDYVKEQFLAYKNDLFDLFFVYKALDDMIPITENDFNNYKDTIIDKYNRQGYLIYRNRYYIFQPFEQNENVPIYYRNNYTPNIYNNISLYNYLYSITKNENDKQQLDIIETEITSTKDQTYNFDDVFDYYDTNRIEWTYVGIIDRDTKTNNDLFKLRPKRDKILSKKRGTGIPSLKGAICQTAKNKKYLEKVAKTLDITLTKNESRDNICNLVKNKLLLSEKYQTGDEKVTYMIIPSNHPSIPFPYNLEDRINFMIDKIKRDIGIHFTHSIKTIKKTSGPEKGYPSFIISLNIDTQLINKIDPKYNPFIEGNIVKIIVE